MLRQRKGGSTGASGVASHALTDFRDYSDFSGKLERSSLRVTTLFVALLIRTA
jgi:hypothetical protein